MPADGNVFNVIFEVAYMHQQRNCYFGVLNTRLYNIQKIVKQCLPVVSGVTAGCPGVTTAWGPPAKMTINIWASTFPRN